MNEYPDLFGETFIGKRYVNNEQFLKSLRKTDICAIKGFRDILSYWEPLSLKNPPVSNSEFFLRYKFIDLNRLQGYVNLQIEKNSLPRNPVKDGSLGHQNLGAETDLCINNIRNVDMESTKRFFVANLLEYDHQNMGERTDQSFRSHTQPDQRDLSRKTH